MRFFISTLLASLASAAIIPSSSPVSYDGHKVFRIKTGKALSQVKEKLSSISPSWEAWNKNIHKHVDVVISPEQLAPFEALKLDCKIMHENLADSIATEAAPPSSLWKRQVDDLAWYDTYHPYDDHIQYWKDLQAAFPNQSEWISSGTSFEGRDLFGLHLWGSGGPGKPAVLYHGTVHAREWITTMAVEYITLQIINGYKSGDAAIRSILDAYDIYVIPIVNPDGFSYAQTTDRLWRKNRQPPPSTSNSTCIGRDINRNWEFAWNPTTGGSSSNPCSQTYAGEAPSDSPENRGLDTLVRKLRDTQGLKLYIDWHSYGQYFLFPYGYNETALLPELPRWTKSGSLMSEAIRDSKPDRRTTFTFGPGGAVLYKSVGNSRDHVYAVGGAEFSWTIELPDTGEFGFVLPPEQIRPTVEEAWTGQQVLLPLLDEVFFDGEGPA
ncbi:metallocarboxypeptidase A-like protein 2 [Elsinoe australis]|uniref:Metallocarboxypeptidase A-like protein 2 n=1 Tax=Elsinoe australis TaxID=40998 RepID=A0A4U7AW02_9PEZI|nr:metallocarboxypeptidase A-like protein 2 [Elsinoe australis]